MKSRSFDVGVSCDVGDKRKKNEDSILVKTTFVNGQEIGVFLVADGMGGHLNGELASSLVAGVISFWWEHHFLDMLINKDPLIEILNSLDNAIRLANYQININKTKSGTTLSLLLLLGDVYVIRHIGDSRIYLLNKKITQLTVDHSYVEEQLSKGNIKRDDPNFHTKKNLLTRCIGTKPKFEMLKLVDRTDINDIFLICSDGFYGFSNDSDVLKIIFNRRFFTMHDKATELRNLIKHGDALDNVSIILIQQFLK